MPNIIITLQIVMFFVAVAVIFTMPENKESKVSKGTPVVIKPIIKLDKVEQARYETASGYANTKINSVLAAYQNWMDSEEHPVYQFMNTGREVA